MKESVIVFGIQEYNEERADIQNRYDVIGISDFDEEKKALLKENETYILPEQLRNNTYDHVLIMGESKVDMFNFLLNHGVSSVNIKLDFLEFGGNSAFMDRVLKT